MEVGQNYLVVTATYILVGTLTSETPYDLTLYPAATVFDTGRLSDALKKGLEKVQNSEIEPHPGTAYVPRGSVMYATDYPHPVPTEVK